MSVTSGSLTSTSKDTDTSGSESSIDLDDEEWNELQQTVGTDQQGNLMIRTLFGGWKTRHFRLHDGKLFEYHKRKHEKPIKVYDIRYSTIADASMLVNKPNVISVSKVGKDIIFLRAHDKEDMNRWLASMKAMSTMVNNPADSLETINDATVVADRNGRIIKVNTAVEKLFGYKIEELIGNNVTVLMFDEVAKHHPTYIKNYLKTGDRKLIGKIRQLQGRHKMGHSLPVEIVLGEFVDKGKRFFMASFRDCRSVSSSPELNNHIEITKSRIMKAVEQELINYTNNHKLLERTRRDMEQENVELKRRQEQDAKEEEHYQQKLSELEKLLSIEKSTTASRFNSAKRLSCDKAGAWVDFRNVIVLEKIVDGKGKTSDIYCCYVDGFLCAMKCVNVENKEKLHRVLEEVKILESLPFNANICRFLHHDFSEDCVRLFMLMYSTSLQRKIDQLQEQGKSFSAQEIAKIAVQILNGLMFLQSHGIIHRDLNSDNILCMLNEREEVTSVAVSDFDSARRFASQSPSSQSTQHLDDLCSVPAYTAPEILSEKEKLYTIKTDVYAFGMLLYELMALERPYFEVDNVPSMIKKILNSEPPSLPELPPEFDVLISLHRDCVNPDPEKRPAFSDVKLQLLHNYW